MTTPKTDLSSPESGFSRRTLLRAGVHAAWSVPLVQVATANPAWATHSGVPHGDPALTLSSATATWSGQQLGTSVTVTNGGFPASSVTVMYSMPWAATAATPSAGWTASGSGTSWSFTNAAGLGANSSMTLTVQWAPNSGANIGATGLSATISTETAPPSAPAGTTVAIPQARPQATVSVTGSVWNGDTLTVTADVANTGAVNAAPMTLAFAMPTSFNTGAADGWSPSSQANNFTFTRNMAAGASISGQQFVFTRTGSVKAATGTITSTTTPVSYTAESDSFSVDAKA